MRRYKDISGPYHYDRDKMVKLESIEQPYSCELVQQLFESMKPNEYVIIEGGGIPEGCTYWLTVVRTKELLYVFNNEVFVRVRKDMISMVEPTENEWKELFLAIGYENFDLSHYDYMSLVIEDFWKQVFNKTMDEMWCSGIITSHGDKCYGHKSDWEPHGIPFHRGALIFLLSYTKELGDTPKHMTSEWVISNYKKYLPMIEIAERNAGILK